jgi:hypothetical protein
MKKILFLVMMMLLLTGKEGLAAGFNLKSIGSVSTDGKQISHWWYSGNQPTFRGEAGTGADVLVSIDGTALQVSADSAGDWVFTPMSALIDGDHQVILTSGGSEIKFTLTIGVGNVDWTAVEKGGGDALPTVGTVWPTIALMGMAVLFLIGGSRVIR